MTPERKNSNLNIFSFLSSLAVAAQNLASALFSKKAVLLFSALLLITPSAYALPEIPMMTSTSPQGTETYSASIEILILLTLLTFLPALLLTMTSFMRIIIILGLLRQALGISQTPSNQILIGISLFMTMFIMAPVLNHIQDEALTPYLDQEIPLQQAIKNAGKPLHEFMLNQTRKDDINFFVNLANTKNINTREEIPFTILVPAYMTSELQTAFQIGFLLFIPFLVIDLIVSTTLMAMGMMMVSPMIFSLPLKIMLFVLINGWHLVFQTLANSFFR